MPSSEPLKCVVSVHRPEDDGEPVSVITDPFDLASKAACSECHRFLVSGKRDHDEWLHQLWRDQYDT